MKMKKYNAPSIAEAMKLIRTDLGEDAVILNSKGVQEAQTECHHSVTGLL